MRIWVEKRNKKIFVNFQPDSKEEERALDKLLGMDKGLTPRQLSGERDRTVRQGALQTAVLGGHESQRWIDISLRCFD
jgi:hypothetical protein